MPTERILELKVTLREVSPPIWRRVRVSAGESLAKLHDALQVAMGWQNKHLHEFETPAGRFGMPNDFGHEIEDERKVRVDAVLKMPRDRISYWYDFGDDWWHDVVFEQEVTPDPGVKYPQVVSGERACPPEDCGGPHRYPELLVALRDPGHREHKDLTQWVGGAFDPEAFDVHERNARLHAITRPRTRVRKRDD